MLEPQQVLEEDPLLELSMSEQVSGHSTKIQCACHQATCPFPALVCCTFLSVFGVYFTDSSCGGAVCSRAAELTQPRHGSAQCHSTERAARAQPVTLHTSNLPTLTHRPNSPAYSRAWCSRACGTMASMVSRAKRREEVQLGARRGILRAHGAQHLCSPMLSS